MCSGFPDKQQYLKFSEENNNSGFIQSNTLLSSRYRLIKTIGQGGFGKTFLAVDEQDVKSRQFLDDSVSSLCVIKQFFSQPETDYFQQKARELFQQESVRLAELGQHCQIPQFLDFFEEEGKQYLVQEWVDGQNLEQELADSGPFNEVEICQLLGELLPLLQFIHTHQVIHRDIKPANIIRRQKDGKLFLVDFGAAKYNWQSWETGTIIGSAEYAAPEQIRGKAVFASDLYSLGITCLHLLTQMSPFDLYDCSEDVWIWQSYLIEPISLSLEKILCKLVHPATKLRYHFAAEALIDLNSSLGNAKTTNTEDYFETPFFELSHQKNSPTSVSAIADNSVYSSTVFDPETQDWYYFPARTEGEELTRKVAEFLSPRLAAAATVPPVKERKSTAAYRKNKHKLNRMCHISVTALAFTIACLILVVESNSISSKLKIEISKIVHQVLNLERN
ncbi:serine/threonine-protein kinase [Anabaena lutea]|uniref:non-specific serine/threonine protein kinase n=1 Tax=Anabaena lutea FACHB-196 TaxID=2692881 RepID=A0ABR8FL90_9NOST|nr:serine/threonine-protein kinase [Anabaena lutea]MBD2570961.1 serine/threonine protein kinase [Anabaena lutea FACHB-196]